MDAYIPSGRLGKMPFIVALAALPLIAALSAAYSYLIVWMPIGGWITLFVMVAYAFACGFVGALAGKWGHCRSPAAMRWIGIALGLFALYAAWMFFLHALLNQGDDEASIVDILTQPAADWQVIRLINDKGWYSIQKMTPSGAVLWTFWAIEAAVVVGIVAVTTRSLIANELYCEGCGRWCASVKLAWRQLTAAQAKAPAEVLDPAELLALPEVLEVAKAGSPRLRIETLTCPACELTSGLRFVRCVDSRNDKGELKTDETVIGPIQLMSDEERARPPRPAAQAG
jgi:hypothetical protein